MMKILLKTDTPQFFNDISEELRLFVGIADISSEFSEAESDLACFISLQDNIANCLLMPYDISASISVPPYNNSLEQKRHQKRAVKLCVYEAMRQHFPTSTPWGSLTGIRPTKLYRDIVNEHGVEKAYSAFKETFSVSDDKIDLVRHIHDVQQPIIRSSTKNAFDLYIGIPYCRSRCLYCSFGTEVSRSLTQLDEYLVHIMTEIKETADLLKRNGFTLRCSYFGGGTPTVLDADRLERLLGFIGDTFNGFGCEFTVEAGRPDTIDYSKLSIMKKAGVTRISINPQSMNDKTLSLIGRSHSANAVTSAFFKAREVGFDNINMDTIAGLPGESLDDFNNTLDRTSELNPDSITVHTLAIKKSSRLKEKLLDYPLPDPDITEKMVQAGYDLAIRNGLRPYYMYRQKYMSGNLENVGYALPGKECIYNIDMMEETVSIAANGAGTISKRVFGEENRVERVASPKDVPTYFAKIPIIINNKEKLFKN